MATRRLLHRMSAISAESACLQKLARPKKDGHFLSNPHVLAYQLLHSGTAGTVLSIPLLVFCTRAVSKRKRERLEMEDRQRDLLPKLSLFQLVQYSKILFIDADTLVTKPLDSVFHDEGTLTQATGTYPETIKEDNGVLPRTCMFSNHGDLQESDHPCPPDPNLDYSNGGFLLFTPNCIELCAYEGWQYAVEAVVACVECQLADGEGLER
ncbi:hypothetical protein LTR73_001616 [Friedmanniomyces endolithicus]|nr:hypothetical protein LTR73_001616 [Friedmanniomyces endolithicus]